MNIVHFILRKKSKTADVPGLDFASLTAQTFTTSVAESLIYLVISIITARILGPTGKGLLTIVILYPTFLFTFGHLSIYRALTVRIAEKRYPFLDFPGTIVVFVIFISILLMYGFLTAFFNFNRYFVSDVSFSVILLALGIIPFSMIIQTFSSMLQAKGRMGEFNIRSLAYSGLVLVFMIIFLAGFKKGLGAAVFSYFMAGFFTTALVIYFVKSISPGKWRFNPVLLGELVKDGIKLHIGVIASSIFLKIDMLMLGYYRQASNVGYYSIAVSFADLITLIPFAIQQVFYSRLSDIIDERENLAKKTVLIYKHALYLSAIAVFFLVLCAKPLIRLIYGESFLPSVLPFMVLLPAVCYLWQNNILASYLVATKRFLLISIVSVLGSLINIILNFMFIPTYGYSGAAVASFITYFVVGSVNFYLFFHISGFNFRQFVRSLVMKKEDLTLYKAFFSYVCH